MSINKIDLATIKRVTADKSSVNEHKSDISIWFDRLKQIDAQQKAETAKNTDSVIYATKQSKKTADCWLLSGLNALNATEFGRKAISEALEVSPNGDRVITLKGLNNRQIKITKAELDAAKASGLYADGDLNVIAFELAFEKIKNEEHPRTALEKEMNGLAINWGESNELFYLISGRKCSTSSRDQNLGKNPRYVDNTRLDVAGTLDMLAENPDSVAMVCSFSMSNGLGKYTIDGVEVSPRHAYAIVGVEKDDNGVEYVLLKNPNDSSKTLRISKQSLLKNVNSVDALPREGVELPVKENAFDKIDIDKLLKK